MAICYTQHALRPVINSESNHNRHFIEIPFSYKGIDFVDLPSIFQDKSMTQSIPTYLQNSEPPIIVSNIISHSEILFLFLINIFSDLDIHANS